MIQLVYKIKEPAKTVLVTDSMRGAGQTSGESIMGSLKNGQKVIIEDGVAKLPDRTAFAGSVATTDRLVKTVVMQAKIPLLDADIVIFDDDITVEKTIVIGKVIYENNKKNISC